MTPSPQRAEPLPQATQAAETPEFRESAPAPQPDQIAEDEVWVEPTAYIERGSGGRRVLGAALGVLAVLWIAYCAWSAGRNLAGQPLSSPTVAQWVARAAGPLALLGLLWLIFGRTRRREAERFTRSVIAMRSEAQSLEALLQVLTRRIDDSRAELTSMAQRMMKLGDEASGRFAGIAEGFDSSTDKLRRHGDALDRAAESARNDIAVLLDDLPRAEDSARNLSQQLRSMGSHSAEQVDAFGKQVVELADRTRKTERVVAEASDRLVGRMTEIETAGASALDRVGKAEASFSETLDMLLERTSRTLEEIRAGISTQSAAVAALVEGTPGFRHVVYSLNRVNGWSGAAAAPLSSPMIATVPRPVRIGRNSRRAPGSVSEPRPAGRSFSQAHFAAATSISSSASSGG